ncbi:putative defense protein [Daphnia pulicaria]|uniref:putative defense protein n=1 Tax=Daphnia pulicaria TaxID=35523 RepID=UPI001EEB3AC3|nr:putative defense protein [Daphnia pulicaria]
MMMSCHKSTVFTCAVASAFLLILVPSIHGTPTGAPAAACKDMTPQHGEVPQTSASPFKTEIPVGPYVLMDDPVKLELRSSSAGDTFKGFLVMAFDIDDDSKPIGTFKTPTDGQAQLMNCTVDGALNAATHTSNSTKSLVNLEWQPPLYFMGIAVFRTTYVKDAKTYWTKTESITVSFVMEIPNSATSLSSVWAGLVAVSLLALLMR